MRRFLGSRDSHAALGQSNHRLGAVTTEVSRTHSGRQLGANRAANRSDRLGGYFARRADSKCEGSVIAGTDGNKSTTRPLSLDKAATWKFPDSLPYPETAGGEDHQAIPTIQRPLMPRASKTPATIGARYPELFWDIAAAFKLARLVQLGRLPVCWSPGCDRAINIRLRGAAKG
jgi:hypothetical protein